MKKETIDIVFDVLALPALVLVLLAVLYLGVLCCVCPLFWTKLRQAWRNARNNKQNAERAEAEEKDMDAKIAEMEAEMKAESPDDKKGE